MDNSYKVLGKTISLKQYADIQDTIDAIGRIIRDNYPAVADIAVRVKADTAEQTFRNIWEYVRKNVRYQNDEIGKEQLRRPQRTISDGKGDCDDMSILISSILVNLGYHHELVIAAYKSKDKWQHIYPVAYSSNRQRYVIDCVPEIPYFNYEASPIKNKIVISMKLEELGSLSDTNAIRELTEPFNINSLEGIANDCQQLRLLQGLLGNVAIVDELEQYDTVLNGRELQQNIILNQLVEARKSLAQEINNPTGMSELNDNKVDLQLVENIINNFPDDMERDRAISEAIAKQTMYMNFYKAVQYGLSEISDDLSGERDDDLYYLKIMKEEGQLDEILSMDDDDMEGLGKKTGFFKKIGSKIKKGVQKLKENHPKLAKVGHAIKKYNPATFAARKSLELFIRANTFNMAEKIALGFATEDKAKSLGYTKEEWQKFVEGKDKAETTWYSLGGDKAYFKEMITKSNAAKKAGLGNSALGSAVLAAVTKVFGAVINFFKNLKLKRKDGTEVKDPTDTNIPEYDTKSTPSTNSTDMETENENTNIVTHEKSGVTTETVTDESGNTTTVYKDKDGNVISRFKAFFLKNKTMIIVVSIVLVVGIIGIVIWKIRQRALHGLGGEGLSKKQENFIKRQGLNNRAYASLVREELTKDGKSDNKTNRKSYYKKIFRDAFSRPLSESQISATTRYNQMYHEARKLAKEKGGGSQAWKDAWAEVKKKSRG